MSRADYLTASARITGRPCKLLSIIVGNDGTNVGYIDVFDGRTANAADKVSRLYGEGNNTKQYRWTGIEFVNGLYIEFTSTIEWVTVEWEHQIPPPPV